MINNLNFGIVTIDPTFSLGEFDITPNTYCHLLLETRQAKTSLIFLDPILFITKSLLQVIFFCFFFDWIVPTVAGNQSVCTDGEQPLINAFSNEFGFSQHLTCFIHVQKNIKEKLSNCNI